MERFLKNRVSHGKEVARRKKHRRVYLALMTAFLLCAPAFAADPTPVPATTDVGLTKVVAGLDMVVTLCQEVWNLLSGNAYFAVYLAVGLLSIGFGVFIRAKRASRR